MSAFTYMSLGGGVQSGTMAEMIVKRQLDKPDVVIFADTGDEPQYVYDYVAYLKERLATIKVECVTVTAGSLTENIIGGEKYAQIPAFVRHGNKIGMMKRQCTANYKITPIEREVKRRLLDWGLAFYSKSGTVIVKRGVKTEAFIGISTDEAARMKPNQNRWCKNRYPLIERRMSRQDCIDWLKKNDLPVPNKSSCIICPYHHNGLWKEIKEQRPEDWEHATYMDEQLRVAGKNMYLHRSCVPLAEIDFAPESLQARLFEDETDMCDGGYCFV